MILLKFFRRDLVFLFLNALLTLPPARYPISIPGHPQANDGMPNNSSVRPDEAMAVAAGYGVCWRQRRRAMGFSRAACEVAVRR